MNEQIAAVIAEIDEHRERFEAFSRSLSEEELDRPVPDSSWLVRDFVAHLATIDGPVTEMFHALRAGTDPGVRDADGRRFNVDQWNDSQVARRRSRGLDELFAEAAEMRARLKDELLGLSDEQLQKDIKFSGDSKRPPADIPLLTYLRGWAKHDPMHALDMLRALPDRRTSELEAWFDHPVIRGYQAAMNRAEPAAGS